MAIAQLDPPLSSFSEGDWWDWDGAQFQQGEYFAIPIVSRRGVSIANYPSTIYGCRIDPKRDIRLALAEIEQTDCTPVVRDIRASWQPFLDWLADEGMACPLAFVHVERHRKDGKFRNGTVRDGTNIATAVVIARTEEEVVRIKLRWS